MRFNRNTFIISLPLISSASISPTCKDLQTMFGSAPYTQEDVYPKLDSAAPGVAEGAFTIICKQPLGAKGQGHSAVFAAESGGVKVAIKYEACQGGVSGIGPLIKNREIIEVVKKLERQFEIDLTPGSTILSRGIPLLGLPAEVVEYKTLPVAPGCREEMTEARYMVMPLAGPSLYRLMQGNPGPVTLLEALHLGAKIYHRLSILHGSGIIHGDLTVHNVLLRENVAGKPNLITSEVVFVDWDRSIVDGCPEGQALYPFDNAANLVTNVDIDNSSTFRADIVRVFEIIISLMLGNGNKGNFAGTVAVLSGGNAQLKTAAEKLVTRVSAGTEPLSAKDMEMALIDMIDIIASSASIIAKK